MILDKISTNNGETTGGGALCRAYQFRLWAEFDQFYLQDEGVDQDVLWTDQEVENNLALRPGTMAVGTPCDRVVPVEVQILTKQPQLNLELWDHVIECSIDVASGRLVVFGRCENFATATRIKLQPGRYRVLVCYGNQFPSEHHTDCSDHYLVML